MSIKDEPNFRKAQFNLEIAQSVMNTIDAGPVDTKIFRAADHLRAAAKLLETLPLKSEGRIA